MAIYWAVAGGGLLLLVCGLLFGDIVEHLLPLDTGGWFSATAIGGFAAAFGLTGALVLSATDSTSAALGAAVVGGLAVGALSGLVTRSLLNRSERAVTQDDYVGTTGVVVSAVPSGGLGEVTLQIAGSPLKVNARSSSALAVGTSVRVTSATSPTSVVVEPL